MKHIFVFLFCLVCLCSRAQQYIVHVEKYDLQNGLSNRQVNYIYKDKRGLLWIGTHYGLNSYDGYNFKFYTREKDGLPFNEVFRIEADDMGNLLLFGESGAKDIAVFNPITHQVKMLGDSYPLFKRYAFADATVVDNGKLYISQPQIDSVWVYSAKQGLSAYAVQGMGAYKLLHKTEGNIYALHNDSTLLLMDEQFHIVNRQKFPFAIKGHLFGSKQNGLLLRENNNYASNSAVSLLFPFTINVMGEDDLPPRDMSRPDFMFDPEMDSTFWRQGKLFDKNRQLIADFAELGYKDLMHVLRAIYRDENNVLWLGGDFGLYKVTVSKNRFRNYFNTPKFNQDNRNSYRGIYIRGDRLYANNESDGLRIVDTKEGKGIAAHSEKEFGGFTFVVPDGQGNLLQGTFAGLHKLNIGTGYTKTIQLSILNNRLWCLHPMGDNLFLAGTEAGLYIYDNTKEQFTEYDKYNSFTSLKAVFILGIEADSLKRNNYWLCTNRGLYILNAEKGVQGMQLIMPSKNINGSSTEVFSLYQDGDSIVWFGTNEGLVKWARRTGFSTLYTRADGLSDNTIYAIKGDIYGSLWLSSNYGLMHFDKTTTQVKTYLVEDGVSNNEFNRISCFVDGKDNIYLGTLNGITSFNPNSFAVDTSILKSPFVITAFYKLDNKTDKMIEQIATLLDNYTIVMDVDDKLFSLEYALLNYNYTGQNLYAYKIDDVNDDWVYSKEHSLSFSRLPYGKHILHIKAKGLNTTWSDEIQVSIIVLRPFYLQGWFFVLVAVLAIIAFYAYDAFRTYSLKREQQRLEEEVSRKTATIMQQAEALKLSLHQKELLLKEIHHRVKNNLQVISGLLSLQGSSSGNSEVASVMNEGRARIKSMALIHQMLYQNDDLQKLNFKEYLKQLLDNILAGAVANGEVAVNIQAEDIWFDIDTAIPLGLIVNEFATNSIKHAFINGKGNIDIAVKEIEAGKFVLVYKDSGKGMPSDFDVNNAKTLGLKLVKMLSAQIKGQIEFISDSGTIIRLEFSSNWKTK